MQCPSCSEPVRPGTTVCTSCWTDLQPAPVGVGATTAGAPPIQDGPLAPAAAPGPPEAAPDPTAPPLLPLPPPAPRAERGWSTPVQAWNQSAHPAEPTAGTNGKAVAAPVLSILWLGGLGSVLAVGLGLLARRELRRDDRRQSGEGLAIAGVVLGVVGLVVPLGLVAIAVPALLNQRDAASDAALGAALRVAAIEQEVAHVDRGTYAGELPAQSTAPGVTVRVVRGDAQQPPPIGGGCAANCGGD